MEAVVDRKATRKEAAEEYGLSYPLGATLVPGGANFSVYSRGASSVELLLFDRQDDSRPSRVIPLDPAVNRTYHYWHAFVPKVTADQIYGYRVNGPWDPANGMRFDPTKVLLDPYGRAVAVPKDYSREATAPVMKSVVVDSHGYDWEGDVPLKRPTSRTVIYEMHVRGFTRHPNSGVEDNLRGTYAGLIEKIPYLQQLGITAVELLPIFQFDPQDAPPGLINYWGYAPVSFFAPHHAYSSVTTPTGPVDEFRDMVKALHRAGIEVILDVVFNHTAEGDHNGPTISFRGLDNGTYYVLEPDRSRYANYSGTGNTLNANHPIVRRMIVDSLRYWVQEMHVDGFRFDLASILSRDSSGQPMLDPPVLWDIESDPALAGTKMIAEAWDAGGLYQVGTFTGDSWREWNGRFRDDVRSFFRGDEGSVAQIADRLLGSPQIYGHKEREAEVSVNFVTCHDGFTLNDLVSYNVKHNDANGESNRDGTDDNRSWNCGVEGPTCDAAIETLRNRQVKNFLTGTMLSLGMPMIGMGDEVRRTQRGNNNAYCHDSKISWFDWSLVSKHADVYRFVNLLIERRLSRFFEDKYEGETLNQWLRESNKAWHGVRLNQPDWSNWSHSVALGAEFVNEGKLVHWILNAYWEPLDFELPCGGVPGRQWKRWIDTSLDAPEDIVPWEDARPCTGTTYRVGPHSVAILYTPVEQRVQQVRPFSKVISIPEEQEMVMNDPSSVVAVYNSHTEAEEAVAKLSAASFDITKVSIIGKDYHTEEKVVGYYSTGDRMKTWGGLGAFWGGIWGLLFGAGFFLIPGIGPVLVAGPFLAALLGALESAVLVGGLSALAAALVSSGIPKDSAIKYEAEIKADKFVLVVHSTGEQLERAQAILAATSPLSIEKHEVAA